MGNCDRFLEQYICEHPSSFLLDIMFRHNMTYVNIYLEKVKHNFNIIFNETIEKYVFLRLSVTDLHEFLKQRTCHSSNEYNYFKGIVLWLKFDVDNRFDNAQLLFSLINYRLCNNMIMLDNDDIDTGNCNLDNMIHQLHINISTNKDAKQLCKVDDINGIYGLRNNNTILNYNFGEITEVIYIKNYLLIISFTEGHMFRFNTINSEIIKCSYPNDYVFNFESSPSINEKIDGNLIAIGGCFNSGQDSDKVKIYNIDTDSWSDSKYLPYGVCNHATVVVDEDIYVIGGCKNFDIIKTVLHYSAGEWTLLASLLNEGYFSTALARDNRIYVYGGYTAYGGYCKPECYNITTNSWSCINTKVYDKVRCIIVFVISA